MRRNLVRLVPLFRSLFAAGVAGSLALAVVTVGACDLPPEEGATSPGVVDDVKRSGLTLENGVSNCYAVVGGGDTFLTSDSSRFYIYTVGPNTAAIHCPIPLPSTTTGIALMEISYIDTNGGGLICQAHSKKNGLDVYTRKLVSTRHTEAGIFKTTDFSTVFFNAGNPVTLECILGPGALLTGYKYAR